MQAEVDDNWQGELKLYTSDGIIGSGVETRTPLPEMTTESRMRMRIQCFWFLAKWQTRF